jgi:PDZ domain-containing protein
MSEHDPDRTAPHDAAEDPRTQGARAVDSAPRAGRGGRAWRRGPLWVRIAAAIATVLVVAGVVADHVDLNEYVITPGVAQPVAPLVKVPKQHAHRVHGKVFLTDVYITRVTALSYLYDELRGDAQILPAETVLGPATPASQLVAQGYLEMEQSQSAAKAAAFTRLGYHVARRDTGVVVFAVVTSSPASRALTVGQVVTAVDGRATPDACVFARALGSHRAGQQVRLAVERSHVNARADIVPGPVVHETVRLGRWPSSVPHPAATPECPGSGWHGQGYLGVETETLESFDFPFPVTLRTTSIGGPSAGLAMTLGIIDTLSGGNLTGGRSIAATGTIAPTGAVGEVGGVPQKTVAVERAGATVFFVPVAQVATARSKATPSLEVYGVRSLAQVLEDLRRLGGTVPPPRA